jgi:hypothetical protein
MCALEQSAGPQRVPSAASTKMHPAAGSHAGALQGSDDAAQRAVAAK